MSAHKSRSERLLRLLPVIVCWSALGFLSACHDDGDGRFVLRGTAVTELDSLAAYLDDPVVQEILIEMPRHTGSLPPNPEGDYDADDTLIVASNLLDFLDGDPLGLFAFCLGSPFGQSIEAEVLDPTIELFGFSFIEGNGSNFTVYTSFRSLQIDSVTGDPCEVHQALVISARLEPDGSLSGVFLGQGVVGLLGNCFDLFLCDFLVSAGTGTRVGPSCGAF